MTPIEELEEKAVEFYLKKEYLVSFLLFHTLTESLLRKFLKNEKREIRFSDLISKLENFLSKPPYRQPLKSIKATTIQLIRYNKFRNKLIHTLWKYGYKRWNALCKKAAQRGYIVYLLLAEYLETFDNQIGLDFTKSKILNDVFEKILKDYNLVSKEES
jgi:hypothetical protein